MSVFVLNFTSRDAEDESRIIGVYSSFEFAVQKIIDIFVNEIHERREGRIEVRDAPYGERTMIGHRESLRRYLYKHSMVYCAFGDGYKITEMEVDGEPVRRRTVARKYRKL